MPAQPSLYPLRISNRYPPLANGADLSFCCSTSEGIAYCKEDRDGRSVRATEWLCTSIAGHVGIVTPRFAVVEDDLSGETAFGSLVVDSPASDFDTRRFLGTAQVGELGQPSEWPGAYMSGLYALDLFLGNADRGANNFMLMQDGSSRRLCAFDFASAALNGLDGRAFPDALTTTVRYGRFLRNVHRFFTPQANEMIDRIAAIPSETIAGFLKLMPPDWMSAAQRERTCEIWSARRFGGRLLALRTGIADGTLL
ncbi:MAG TPA: HipA family kinase [Allosphingosinicella sp.]